MAVFRLTLEFGGPYSVLVLGVENGVVLVGLTWTPKVGRI